MGIELRDNKGLICGFRSRSGEPARCVDTADGAAPEAEDGLLWLHFNLNDTRARGWIGGCAWLGEESRESLLSSNRGIRLEAHGNGAVIAGVLADAYADDEDQFGALYLHVDRNCLITGRHHPLASAGLLHAELGGGAAFADACELFNRLLEHLAATFARAAAAFADQVDDTEEQVFAGDYQHAQLGRLRRAMARMRRQIVANRHALSDFIAHPPTWWRKAAAKDLRRIAATLSTAAQDLELAQERARLLGEEIDSRQTERTNRNLYFISLAAAVFLPITLISGIFGMNVGGLPWVEDPRGFFWAMACMAAAVAIAFLWLLWRRML